jgi:hypothetical protein
MFYFSIGMQILNILNDFQVFDPIDRIDSKRNNKLSKEFLTLFRGELLINFT